MNPFNPDSDSDADPNLEMVRRLGWTIKAASGRYCVAWRGPDEIVLVWRGGRWERTDGGELSAAA